jgi:TetR/AcrR family transcriptional regulator
MPTCDNRQRLLQVALSRFAARGYDATGVQEIAEAAGVTKPTLYHYFGSKVGLLEALIQTYSRDFLEAFEEAARYQRDQPRSLGRILAVTLDFAKRQPDFFRFQLMLRFLPAEHEARRASTPLFFRQMQALETMFRAAEQDHGNMRGRHPRYAQTYYSHVLSCAMLVLDGILTDSDRLRHDMVQQFSHGLYS